MKYKDPGKIAEEKQGLTLQVAQLQKQINKSQQLLKMLPELDDNCVCFLNGIVQYISHEEARFKYYDDEDETWSEWVDFEPAMNQSAFALEFSGNKVICCPCSEYFEKYADRKSLNISNNELEQYKVYSPNLYIYSQQAVDYFNTRNQEIESENKKNGEKDLNKGKILLSGWFVTTPRMVYMKGKTYAVPSGKWSAIEDFLGMEMQDSEKAMETAAFRIFYKTLLYKKSNEANYSENKVAFIENMKAGKFPDCGAALKVDFSWQGACGKVSQAADALPNYIETLIESLNSVNNQLQEIENQESISPEEIERVRAKEKAEKLAMKQEKAKKKQDEEALRKYLNALLMTKWGVVIVAAIAVSCLCEYLDLSALLYLIIPVVWLVMKMMVSSKVKSKRRQLGLQEE